MEETPLVDALAMLKKQKSEHLESRCAIIYRHGILSIEEELRKHMDSAMCSWGEVDAKQISIISVETAKGLEFENVVVIADQMTFNEKYIAFTRALDKLFVVKDEFAPNPEIDDQVEDDE